MIDRNIYETFNDLIEKECEEKLPKRSYTGLEARIEYYKLVRQIEENIDKYFNAKQLPLEQKARLCCHLRNLLKVKARDSIKISSQARNFMTTLPVRTWQSLVIKYNSNWKEIIAASMRTDPRFDKYLGEID